jgi:hypothetical protein
VEAEAGEDDQEGQGALQHRPLLLRVQQGVLVHGRHGEQVHHLEPESESESERERERDQGMLPRTSYTAWIIT